MAMFAFDEEINLASDDESVDNAGLNESFENETQEVRDEENTKFNAQAEAGSVEPSSSYCYCDVPQLEMKFDTDECAYHYYNTYAKKAGFSIRKKTMYQRAGKVITRVLCCSREGEYSKKLTPQKKRDSKRCGCLAMFEVKRSKDDKLVLVRFVEDHNHPLECPETSNLLRSHRHIEPSQVGLIKNMRSSGIRTSNIFSYLSNEAGGAENLNFIQSDCYNLVSKTRTEFLCRGDEQCLLDYLMKKQDANKSYFYKLRMDEDNRICSCFISDPKSRCDYAHFGDVVCFDTTYKTNNYQMICAPIIGPVRKKRTGEGTGRLKNALEKRPKAKRKTTPKASESVPIVLPNQDFNFPGYSLNQMNQSNVRYPAYQVGPIGMPLMPSDHPFIYNQGMQGSSHMMNLLIGQPTTYTQCSQSSNIAIHAQTQPAKRLDFTDFSVLERGAGRSSLDPSV